MGRNITIPHYRCLYIHIYRRFVVITEHMTKNNMTTIASCVSISPIATSSHRLIGGSTRVSSMALPLRYFFTTVAEPFLCDFGGSVAVDTLCARTTTFKHPRPPYLVGELICDNDRALSRDQIDAAFSQAIINRPVLEGGTKPTDVVICCAGHGTNELLGATHIPLAHAVSDPIFVRGGEAA